MKIKYLTLFFIFLIVGCNKENADTDFNVSVVRNEGFFKLQMSFNIKRLRCFYFDPLIFNRLYDSVGYRKVDSVINSNPDISRISNFHHKSLLVLENPQGQRKVFIVDYNIINGRRTLDLSMPLYKKNSLKICYPKHLHFNLDRDIYGINELRVKNGDSKVRFLYLYGNQIKTRKRILYSNWVNLNRLQGI